MEMSFKCRKRRVLAQQVEQLQRSGPQCTLFIRQGAGYGARCGRRGSRPGRLSLSPPPAVITRREFSAHSLTPTFNSCERDIYIRYVLFQNRSASNNSYPLLFRFVLLILHEIGDKGSCNGSNTDVGSVKLCALEALLLLNSHQCQLICFSRSRQGLGGFVVAPLRRVLERRGSTHTRALSSPSFNHNFPESLDLVPYAVHELFVLLGFRFFLLQLFADFRVNIDGNKQYIVTDYVSTYTIFCDIYLCTGSQ